MCGRYALMKEKLKSELFGKVVFSVEEKLNFSEICPGMHTIALISGGDSCAAFSMQWGFTGYNHGTVINARIEDVYNRAMFKGLADRQRCLLPSNGYFEWRMGDGQKFLIYPEQGKEVCLLAGLYRSDDNGNLSFVILTRPAEGNAASIHDRMPVLFDDEKKALAWIRSSNISMLEGACLQLKLEAEGNEQLSMIF